MLSSPSSRLVRSRSTDVEAEAQVPGKRTEDFFLFSSFSSPWPLQAPGAVLGAEDEVLSWMGWFPPSQSSRSRILGNKYGIS